MGGSGQGTCEYDKYNIFKLCTIIVIIIIACIIFNIIIVSITVFFCHLYNFNHEFTFIFIFKTILFKLYTLNFEHYDLKNDLIIKLL